MRSSVYGNNNHNNFYLNSEHRFPCNKEVNEEEETQQIQVRIFFTCYLT